MTKTIGLLLLLVGGFMEAQGIIAERNYQVVRGNMAAGVMAAYVTPDATPVPPPTPPKPPTPKKAVATEKLSFVEFAASWCGPCKELEKTLNSAEVKTALEAFNVYRLDIDKDKELANKYKVNSVPAYFIVKADGTIVRKGVGSQSPETFLSWLKGN